MRTLTVALSLLVTLVFQVTGYAHDQKAEAELTEVLKSNCNPRLLGDGAATAAIDARFQQLGLAARGSGWGPRGHLGTLLPQFDTEEVHAELRGHGAFPWTQKIYFVRNADEALAQERLSSTAAEPQKPLEARTWNTHMRSVYIFDSSIKLQNPDAGTNDMERIKNAVLTQPMYTITKDGVFEKIDLEQMRSIVRPDTELKISVEEIEGYSTATPDFGINVRVPGWFFPHAPSAVFLFKNMNRNDSSAIRGLEDSARSRFFPQDEAAKLRDRNQREKAEWQRLDRENRRLPMDKQLSTPQLEVKIAERIAEMRSKEKVMPSNERLVVTFNKDLEGVIRGAMRTHSVEKRGTRVDAQGMVEEFAVQKQSRIDEDTLVEYRKLQEKGQAFSSELYTETFDEQSNVSKKLVGGIFGTFIDGLLIIDSIFYPPNHPEFASYCMLATRDRMLAAGIVFSPAGMLSNWSASNRGIETEGANVIPLIDSRPRNAKPDLETPWAPEVSDDVRKRRFGPKFANESLPDPRRSGVKKP